MKITHVIIGLGVGGAELMMKRLIESHALAFGAHHSVISLTSIGKVGEELRLAGFSVTALGMKSGFDLIPTFFKLVKSLRKARPNIVQTWMYHADLMGGLAAWLIGNREVVWGIRTTSLSENNARATFLIRGLCARLSAKIPKVIVCAAQASLDSHAAIGYCAHKMQVIPNGFALEKLVAKKIDVVNQRKKYCLDKNLLIVGSVGRFNHDKDQKNFIGAAKILLQKNKKVHFVLIGLGCDDSNQKLKKWLMEAGCSDNFTLLGERKDISVCLAAIDVFCLSSRTEGFPNVLGEAMALSIPCVTTDVGDAKFLIGDCGIVVQKEDRWELAKGIEILLDLSDEQRQCLGEKAKARIHSQFSMDRTTRKFDEIYRNIKHSYL